MTKRIISLEISEDLITKLHLKAKENETSVSGLIRLIIREYFNNIDKCENKEVSYKKQ